MDLPASTILKTTAFCVSLFILASLAQQVSAHASIEQRIVTLSKKLDQDPGNIELYLLRGELYASHEAWLDAEADYEQVIQLDPQNLEVHLYLGKMYLSSNRSQKAEAELKHFLEYLPDHSQARITLAKTLLKLDRRLQAVDEYSRGISLNPQPSPDWYLQRAKALSEAGEGYLQEAIGGLDQGIQKLGPLVVLQLYAVELELRRNQYDAALVRLDQVAAQSSRQESWLMKRAQILAKAGRSEEAMETLDHALLAFNSLPQHRRNTIAMRQLEEHILIFQKSLALNNQ
jgi:tetratricopeptide (TPR) repeat protein